LSCSVLPSAVDGVSTGTLEVSRKFVVPSTFASIAFCASGVLDQGVTSPAVAGPVALPVAGTAPPDACDAFSNDDVVSFD